MTFHEYLRSIEDDDSPHGDVARDVLADKKVPVDSKYDDLRQHVASCGAPPVVLDLLDEVHADFERSEAV